MKKATIAHRLAVAFCLIIVTAALVGCNDDTDAGADGTLEAPAVTTGNASDVSFNSAVLNGNVTSLGTASSVCVSFQWGKASGSYTGETASETKNGIGAFIFNLTGLASGTTYYFVAKVTGYGTSYGIETSFITTARGPAVTTSSASDITRESATLNGTLTSLGAISSLNVSFQWGQTPGMYSGETAAQTMTDTGTFTCSLSGLASGTTYYFRAKAEWNEIAHGDEMSFSTIPTETLSVATGAASDVTISSAILNGNLTSLGAASSATVSFQWGKVSGSYTAETVPQIMTDAVDFSFRLTGLCSETTYYFRARATGDGSSDGPERTFKTKGYDIADFCPCGWMGDTEDIAFNDACSDNPRSPDTCISITYLPQGSEEWAGIYWLYPDCNWGHMPDARDLTGAAKCVFWARGEKGGETAEFKVGGVAGDYEDSIQPAVSSGVIVLSSKWKMYAIDLGGEDLSHVIGGFCWVTNRDQNPGGCMIYLDDIAYVAECQEDGTPAEAPAVTTGATSVVGTQSATLNGLLTSLGTATTVRVSFEWGTTSGSYADETAAQTMANTGAFSFGLTGLVSATTYYFRAKAVGDDTAYGAETSFSTADLPVLAVTTGAASDVTISSATLNGSLTSLGTASNASVCFQWGTTSASYTAQTVAQMMTNTGTFSFHLTGLCSETTYYFRAKATGGGTSLGPERAFRTARYDIAAFYPCGWMGDTGDIAFSDACPDNPRSPDTCISITYLPQGYQGWAGIYWLYPDCNWGDSPEARDLTGAAKCVFWARGQNGGEIAEFKVGGVTGDYQDSIQPAVSSGVIVLSGEWKRYTVDLRGKDLSHVIGGFCWVTNRDQNPEGCTIYLDDIAYVAECEEGEGTLGAVPVAEAAPNHVKGGIQEVAAYPSSSLCLLTESFAWLAAVEESLCRSEPRLLGLR